MNRQELEQRRDELQQRLKAVERDLGSGLDRDPEEQAQELENRDTLLEIARVAERELRDVEVQLRELDET